MKSVLISIQPYWVFLIIAKIMGWNVDKQKTIEVRKNYPKDQNWNKGAKIYCSKDKKSFSRIPKEYQPFMEKFLGKVIGEFVCEEIIELAPINRADEEIEKQTCLSRERIVEYLRGKGYGWHISNLIIYDKPKELSEFRLYNVRVYYDEELKLPMPTHEITRPPQSWCYVQEIDNGKE